MPMKFCLDCHTLTDNGSRCPPCQAAFGRRISAKRGSTKRRGLGGGHRRAAEKIVGAAQVCVICGKPPTPTDPLQADHTVPRAQGGGRSPLRAVHRSYNASRGGDMKGGRCMPQ
jgi:hypothetical protein